MTCLIDYIGIRYCGEESPESGVFINSLPGISLESIDKIANEDQVTFLRVWEDVQQEAATRFFNDFVEKLTECYRLNPYCDYEQMICDNKRVLLNAWKYLLGNQIMLYRIHTTRINRFTTVDIDQARELKDHYQVEYENALKQAVKLADTSSCCLKCNPNPTYATWLP